MICPICNKRVPRSHFSCASGAKGGKAKGPQKARSSEQARAAVMARWKKYSHGKKEYLKAAGANDPEKA
jgi:hypothetical protein